MGWHSPYNAAMRTGTLQVETTTRAARTWTDDARSTGQVIGLVPTMGALHDGHFALIERARRDCDRVVVSVFINPLQFSAGEDLDRYPRTTDDDLRACLERGVDMVFCPAAIEMYPTPITVSVAAGALADRLCGRDRPGHFDGVCTVVTKLFQIIPANRAYFGEKDFQQLVIIRRMVGDLNIPIDIVGCPTIRESDGLALSSRNRFLSQETRRQAACIYAALTDARQTIASGETDAAVIVARITDQLLSGGADRVDYVEMVDPQSLDALKRIDGIARICVAARFGGTRLIDNISVDAPPTGG